MLTHCFITIFDAFYFRAYAVVFFFFFFCFVFAKLERILFFFFFLSFFSNSEPKQAIYFKGKLLKGYKYPHPLVGALSHV